MKRPTFPQLHELLSQVLKEVFSPEEDYYTGEAGADDDNGHTNIDEVISDYPKILEKRIIVSTRSNNIPGSVDRDEIFRSVRKDHLRASKSDIDTELAKQKFKERSY